MFTKYRPLFEKIDNQMAGNYRSLIERLKELGYVDSENNFKIIDKLEAKDTPHNNKILLNFFKKNLGNYEIRDVKTLEDLISQYYKSHKDNLYGLDNFTDFAKLKNDEIIMIKSFLESLVDENIDIEKIANDISKKLHCDRFGSCIHFAEMLVEKLKKEILSNKVTFKVIEGWVNEPAADPPKMAHTWIELKGKKIDPTFSQFSNKATYSSKIHEYEAKEYIKLVNSNNSYKKARKRFLKK